MTFVFAASPDTGYLLYFFFLSFLHDYYRVYVCFMGGVALSVHSSGNGGQKIAVGNAFQTIAR